MRDEIGVGDVDANEVLVPYVFINGWLILLYCSKMDENVLL